MIKLAVLWLFNDFTGPKARETEQEETCLRKINQFLS